MVTIPLDRMSVEEKLAAIETIWSDLARVPEAVASPAWHEAVFRDKEKRAAEGCVQFLSIRDRLA